LIVAPVLAAYGVESSVWKHERILKDLKKGDEYLSIFYDLMDSGSIVLVEPDRELATRSYALACKHGIPVYDAAFVSLALDLGVKLKTFDEGQKMVFNEERASRRQPPSSTKA
jgi:predicted nucleic acid-binding protein